jgi:LmbE family N-acetylglucosaminyl deacetylase
MKKLACATHVVARAVAHQRFGRARELGHVLEQLLLGNEAARTGVDVDHARALAQLDGGRQLGVVAARQHVHAMAARGQPARDVRDVDVLPAGIDAAESGEGRSVLADHRDAQGTAHGRGLRCGDVSRLRQSACRRGGNAACRARPHGTSCFIDSSCANRAPSDSPSRNERGAAVNVRERCRGARVLVLSPHLDDAVFSCGELLTELRRPVVATLFAGVPPPGTPAPPWDAACGFADGQQAMRERRLEDAEALRLLGALPEHFDFLDHQYADALGVPRPPDRLAAGVAALIEAHRPDVTLLPLGLFHSDHALLHDAALACRGAPCAWLAYEDVPYRRQPGLLQQRLQALAGRGLVATPMAERGRARERKQAAVRTYRSQCRAFGETSLSDTDAPEGYWLLEAASLHEAGPRAEQELHGHAPV